MASEEPVPEKKKAPAPKQEVFKIHSMVRKIATRNQRMKAAAHHRFVQRFGGGRITVRRARPATVTKALLMQYKAEIQKAVEEGKVVVKTMIGEVVDLNTFTPIPAAAPATKPLPHPPLDSAKDDKTFEYGVGVKTELFEGGGVPGGPTPPLNVKPPLMSSDEKPIETSGDPVRARAEAAQGGEKSDSDEEPLGDDEPTQPDALNPQDPDSDTAPGSKRGKDKKSKKDGPK